MSETKQSTKQKTGSARRICVIFLPEVVKDNINTTIISTLSLLEPITQKIYAITGNFPEDAITSDKTKIININIETGAINQSLTLVRIFKFIIIQLMMSYQLCKIAREIDVVFLAAGTQALLLPSLTAKILRKKLIFSHLGLTASFQSRIGTRTGYQLLYDRTLFGLGKYILPWFVELLEGINYRLADRVIVFLSSYKSPFLKGREDKVIFGGSRFYVDTETFKAERDIDDREKLVGFIGRFEEIKGVMNFIQAISPVLDESPDIKILIGGDGVLKGKIKNEITKMHSGERVILPGWIAHDKLPEYLNSLKLLVIPSYGEIGPHIVFEAMACGTPVLGTPVGIMRDVIKDGETGFLLADNSPESIVRNILRVLSHPELMKVTSTARRLIEKEYTYTAAVKRYEKVLESLS